MKVLTNRSSGHPVSKVPPRDRHGHPQRDLNPNRDRSLGRMAVVTDDQSVRVFPKLHKRTTHQSVELMLDQRHL